MLIYSYTGTRLRDLLKISKTTIEKQRFPQLVQLFRQKFKEIKYVELNTKTITILVREHPTIGFRPIKPQMENCPILDTPDAEC